MLIMIIPGRRARGIAVRCAALICLLAAPVARAQKAGVAASLWEGTVVTGYIDQGAFVNFTGPGIRYRRDPYSLLLGVLPSLKFKRDRGEVKNALVTPSLGAGITLVYRRLALQVPFYYLPKNGNTDGKWKTGIGIGVRL